MYYDTFGLDITMCFGDNCPLKKKCIRYLTKPEKYQSYFTNSPYKDGKCRDFIDYNRYDKKWIREELLK